MRDVFDFIHQTNYWGDDDSVSGQGSNLEATAAIRKELPKLVKALHVESLLDIPCGDHFWGRLTTWPPTYIGADIVPGIIEANRQQFDDLRWEVLDITTDRLPRVDLVLCRDLLGHFSNRDVQLALRNLKRSGSKYLLATTFPQHNNEITDIKTGEWRPINLASLFGLPNPILLINENCTAGGGRYADKSLGLWRIDQ